MDENWGCPYFGKPTYLFEKPPFYGDGNLKFYGIQATNDLFQGWSKSVVFCENDDKQVKSKIYGYPIFDNFLLRAHFRKFLWIYRAPQKFY